MNRISGHPGYLVLGTSPEMLSRISCRPNTGYPVGQIRDNRFPVARISDILQPGYRKFFRPEKKPVSRFLGQIFRPFFQTSPTKVCLWVSISLSLSLTHTYILSLILTHAYTHTFCFSLYWFYQALFYGRLSFLGVSERGLEFYPGCFLGGIAPPTWV